MGMIRAYMVDDITVIYSNGVDIHGEPEATTDVEMKAYIVWETHLIRGIPGEKVISSPMISRGRVYVIPDRTITHADIIKIDTVEYAIMDISRGKDFSENHQEVHLA